MGADCGPWAWCRAKAGTTSPPFGPKGGCDGDAFPYRACPLKTQAGGFPNATIYASGPAQPWVSGKA